MYCLPTEEVDLSWLRNRIAGRKALEICAGNGAIGRALEDRLETDSHIQTMPEMAAYYKLLGQHPITACRRVQVRGQRSGVGTCSRGSFSARTSMRHEVSKKATKVRRFVGSSVYGVDELGIVAKVQTYDIRFATTRRMAPKESTNCHT